MILYVRIFLFVLVVRFFLSFFDFFFLFRDYLCFECLRFCDFCFVFGSVYVGFYDFRLILFLSVYYFE